MENNFKISKSSNLEKNENLKKKLFVEIGTSMSSIPLVMAVQGREMESDMQYVGVDIDDVAIEENQANFGSDNILFKHEDAEKMTSFEDASVETVFIGNVFGSNIVNSMRANILSSALRILKSDGQIIIKETNTPFSEDLMKKMLDDAGVKYRVVKPEQTEEWNELIRNYNGTYPQADDSYFIIAGK